MKNQSANPPAGVALPLWYFYLTAAVTGGAVLIVEILGAKMLAPYLGTSHFVWTAQITVTLLALAIGYHLGGKLTSRSGAVQRLYRLLIVAGIYLAVATSLVETVCMGCLQWKLAVGSLVASMFLFLVPLILLAMTVPILIRELTVSAEKAGENAGRLSAISTLGSVIGTLLIGYVLIPLCPNSVTMWATAGCIVALGLSYFVFFNRAAAPTMLLIIGALLASLTISSGTSRDRSRLQRLGKLLHQQNSHFGTLMVVEEEYSMAKRRMLLNDLLVQNTYEVASGQSLSVFTVALHGLARMYVPEIRNVLCVGLGVGIVPMEFARDGARVEVVEISDKVSGIAQSHFGFDPKKVRLIIDDGRHHLNVTTQEYDAIILDAFLGDSSPSHLLSREAFAIMKRRLHKDGVLVMNCFGEFDLGKEDYIASIDRTLRAVFDSVLIHASGNGNVFFVASSKAVLKPAHEADIERAHPWVRSEAGLVFSQTRTVPTERGRLLRDDHNPVEYYDAENREQYRRLRAESLARR